MQPIRYLCEHILFLWLYRYICYPVVNTAMYCMVKYIIYTIFTALQSNIFLILYIQKMVVGDSLGFLRISSCQPTALMLSTAIQEQITVICQVQQCTNRKALASVNTEFPVTSQCYWLRSSIFRCHIVENFPSKRSFPRPVMHSTVMWLHVCRHRDVARIWRHLLLSY